MSKFGSKLKIIVIVSLVLALSRGQAGAVEQSSLGIVPAKPDLKNKSGAWFVYDKKPGEVVSDKVAVVNLSDDSIEVEVYPVDATTTKDGVFTLKNNQEESVGVGLWIDGLPDKVTLAPKERKVLDFSLTVPEGAKAGDYLGGLVVERLDNRDRNGSRLYLTVPGEVNRSAEISNLEFRRSGKDLKFLLDLKNTGNVRLESLLVKVKLSSKWKVPAESRASYPQAGILFPEGEISLELPWENSRPILGKFDAEIEVLFGSELRLKKTVEFWIINWTKLLIATGVLVASLFGLRIWFKQLKKQRLIRQKERKEREKVGGEMDAEWLKEQLRVVVREELERLVSDGKIDYQGEGKNKGKRFVNPPGIKLPRGVHSREVANGKKKKFFFAKKKSK